MPHFPLPLAIIELLDAARERHTPSENRYRAEIARPPGSPVTIWLGGIDATHVNMKLKLLVYKKWKHYVGVAAAYEEAMTDVEDVLPESQRHELPRLAKSIEYARDSVTHWSDLWLALERGDFRILPVKDRSAAEDSERHEEEPCPQ